MLVDCNYHRRSRRAMMQANMTWVVSCVIVMLLFVAFLTPVFADGVDWAENQKCLDKWKALPIGNENSQIKTMFDNEGFGPYLEAYMKHSPLGNYKFELAKGVDIIGPLSGQHLRIPFPDYLPLPEGPVGDPKRTYTIGFLNHSLAHPWLLNLSDSAEWEARRHPNVRIIQMDAEFDDAKQSAQMDALIAKKVDGIVIWPRVEAASALPVERAMKAGIPVVSVDRMVGTDNISCRVTGNFAANGTLLGMYVADKLQGKGNVVLLRKAKGGTADTQRTGNFLRVLSHYPGINILATQHTMEEVREEAASLMLDVLMSNPNIDAIFTTGAEHTAGVLIAMRESNRWFSRPGGKKVLLVTPDDSKELLRAVQDGEVDALAPYTPLIGDIAVRALLKIITGEKVPKDVVTPDLPLITQRSEVVFGYRSITPADWLPFAYGPDLK